MCRAHTDWILSRTARTIPGSRAASLEHLLTLTFPSSNMHHVRTPSAGLAMSLSSVQGRVNGCPRIAPFGVRPHIQSTGTRTAQAKPVQAARHGVATVPSWLASLLAAAALSFSPVASADTLKVGVLLRALAHFCRQSSCHPAVRGAYQALLDPSCALSVRWLTARSSSNPGQQTLHCAGRAERGGPCHKACTCKACR